MLVRLFDQKRQANVRSRKSMRCIQIAQYKSGEIRTCRRSLQYGRGTPSSFQRRLHLRAHFAVMSAVAATACRQTQVFARPKKTLKGTDGKEQSEDNREGTPHLA
jgi:hypothetical protein